ncbi:MAG: serine/threonine-protein kinase, partial [Planctomycetaceae bacterium]
MTAADGSQSNAFPSSQLRSLQDRLIAGWQQQRPVSIEALLEQVPDHHRLEAFLELLRDELTWRLGAEVPPPTPGEYLTRFPHHAPQIEQVFREIQGNSEISSTEPRRPAATGDRLALPPRLGNTVIGPAPEADPLPPGDPTPLADSSQQKPPSLPKFIGRFRVLRRLGAGGFGDVYLAEDHNLERLVAIKVPNEKALRESADNWLREARTVAQLKHPHIVPVFDVGSTPEVPGFIVSEYIEGCTLAQRLKQSPLPLAEVVQLVIDVAEALDYAHHSKADVVHRDIKPGNLLLDTQGRVYVADFGLAIREVDLHQDLPTAGTPAYMSPEQIRAEGHRIDGRSDIFSLGVVLYELLTGRRPFKGSSFSELRREITQRDPRPPRQINLAVDRELERICLKALAKLPSDRYSTAYDFADDLRQLRDKTWGLGGVSQVPGVATPLTPVARAGGPGTPTDPGPAGSGAAGSASAGAEGSDGRGSAAGGSDASSGSIAIVPKGLRSFDREDAKFFLELLSGPSDREGLPESLRFWKQRIDPSPDG